MNTCITTHFHWTKCKCAGHIMSLKSELCAENGRFSGGKAHKCFSALGGGFSSNVLEVCKE